MSESNNPKAHALVFPYPYLGHISPTLNLAERLASGSFTVTFVLPEYLHRRHFEPPTGSSGTIRFTGISDEFDRESNLNVYWESMIADFPARVDEFVTSVKKSDEMATEFFLVTDTMYTWPSHIATKHGLVNVLDGNGSVFQYRIPLGSS